MHKQAIETCLPFDDADIAYYSYDSDVIENDVETGWYYLQSRYYDPEVMRFVNADREISGIGGDVRAYNLFSYCMNNPVNKADPSGYWPQWLTGALNVVSGTLQTAAGVALGMAAGWTGIGLIAAGILIANGTATAIQGVGQIVNSAAG